MSGLPVLGEKFNPYTRQSSEPWVLANELKRDYNLKQIDFITDQIDPSIQVLLVLHPKDLPESTEYALDQFVLRGGKLIAFVDPYAYFDQQPSPIPGVGGGGTSSTLPRLFKVWGVEMNPGKVVADMVYYSGQGQRMTPTVLTLNRNALNRDDVVTSQIETLLYAFGGAFEVKLAEGLKATNLVTGSKESMLVDNVVATVSGEAATKGFVPDGKDKPLALRLSGKFKSAFPDGRPKDDSKKPKPGPAAPHLKEGAGENSVILVADVDMLNDGAAVDVQEVFGRRIVVPSNGNLAFAQAMVEQVYLPARQGSLQVEMLVAPRRHGLISYELEPRFDDLLREVAAGTPVIVLENYRLKAWPLWHYAVVVGYDLDRSEVIRRSGTRQRQVMPFPVFEYVWKDEGYWAMVVVPPDRVPATATEARYGQAVAALERSGNVRNAHVAYTAMLGRWPGSLIGLMGSGNTAYALKDLAAKGEIMLTKNRADADRVTFSVAHGGKRPTAEGLRSTVRKAQS